MRRSIADIVAVVSLLAGISLTLLFGFALVKEFNPLLFERSERVIAAKQSELRQSFLPQYYVFATDESGTDMSKQRVSKNKLLSAQTGDEISGFEKNGTFYTGRQIVSDVMWTAVFLIIGLALFLLGLSMTLRKTAFMENLRVCMHNFRLRMPRNVRESWKYILLSLGVIWLFGGYALHFFHIHFFSHQETTAEIVDAERDPGYGRFNAPTYYFTFHYEHAGEPIFVKTSVDKEMYDAYAKGSTLAVWHKTNNPYYAYTPSEVNADVKRIFGWW